MALLHFPTQPHHADILSALLQPDRTAALRAVNAQMADLLDDVHSDITALRKVTVETAVSAIAMIDDRGVLEQIAKHDPREATRDAAFNRTILPQEHADQDDRCQRTVEILAAGTLDEIVGRLWGCPLGMIDEHMILEWIDSLEPAQRCAPAVRIISDHRSVISGELIARVRSGAIPLERGDWSLSMTTTALKHSTGAIDGFLAGVMAQYIVPNIRKAVAERGICGQAVTEFAKLGRYDLLFEAAGADVKAMTKLMMETSPATTWSHALHNISDTEALETALELAIPAMMAQTTPFNNSEDINLASIANRVKNRETKLAVARLLGAQRLTDFLCDTRTWAVCDAADMADVVADAKHTGAADVLAQLSLTFGGDVVEALCGAILDRCEGAFSQGMPRFAGRQIAVRVAAVCGADTEAWALFFTLAEGFEGTLSELLDMVKALGSNQQDHN